WGGFSEAQLAIARHRHISQSPHLPLEWILGDALRLPLESGIFDCITMGYGLRNVTDIPRSLQEIHRLLKPGAKAALLDFHQPDQALWRRFQGWYLDTIVVPLAQNYGLTDEYAYITSSLARFPLGPEQVELAYQAGFAEAIHYPIAGGHDGGCSFWRKGKIERGPLYQ
ncbi:MAG: class I SAM-dependent methyltransferase, partial [Acaryochloridaceae cyanobacterium CSU_5_19]|nr:class I SAM-dependent methyltransferase [Acaryochloridaceae cyanobacterium CSU_5_19]